MKFLEWSSLTAGLLEEMMKTSSHSVPAFRFMSQPVRRLARALVIPLATLFLLAGAAAAQSKGSSGSASRGSTNTRTPSNPDLSTQPTFIAGKVMLDGG